VRRLDVFAKRFPMREPFVIAGKRYDATETIQVRISEGAATGRGEGIGVDYRGETVERMVADVELVRGAVESGADIAALTGLLKPGGAMCALDAALLDLQSKTSGVSVANRLGLTMRRPQVTALTIGMRSLAETEKMARRFGATASVIKVKVDDDEPLARIAAVHEAAPHAALIVDPNQSWPISLLKELAPRLLNLGVALLEQPIAVGAEAGLDGWRSSVPLAADELIQTADDLPRAKGRFQVVNVKLDKTGGLRAALALAEEATAMGFSLMVGCMAGSSLSMAPALLFASRCDFVDLDGPVLQIDDWPDGFRYDGGAIYPAQTGFWG
jgi:L-alanine-DL-glutamate epimerase-like enolase superfamily enzyme